MLKQQLVFLGQLGLLYPIAVVLGGLMVPHVGSQPQAIGRAPVILALAFGLLTGAGLSTLSETIRDTAPFVGLAPAGFLLMYIVGKGSIPEELYIVAGANEGGLGVAIITLPVFFYAGYSLGSFAFTRVSEKSEDCSDIMPSDDWP